MEIVDYQKVLDELPDLYYLVDPTGKFIDGSLAVEAVLGYTRSELIGQRIWKLFPHLQKLKVAALITEDLIQGYHEAKVVQIIKKNGQTISLEVKAKLLNISGKKVILGIARDVTQREKTQIEITRLRLAVENSGESIFMTDPNGIFTFVNPAFEKLYGYSASEIVGKDTPRIIKSGIKDLNFYKGFWHEIKSGHQVKVEMINKTKNGSQVIVEASVNPIFDASKEIVGFLAVQHDITNRKARELESEEIKKKLQQKVIDMEKIINVTLDREAKISELKQKIIDLENQLHST